MKKLIPLLLSQKSLVVSLKSDFAFFRLSLLPIKTGSRLKRHFIPGITLAAMMLLLVSCARTGADIPNVAVNFQDAVTDPRLSALNVPGGAVLISGYGVAGLILYREADGTYACYDRCSTVNPQKLCAVNLNSGNFTVTDPCSGGEWDLIDGSPVKAPATISLRQYNIVVSNFEIYVSN